jgi:peptidoglycan/xylan/chitin deacetylase (PgdA/CDA1 family)
MKELLLIQPNSLVYHLYPKALWHGDRSKKEIFLTFDDGPISGLTEWVLDELKKHSAGATFFCVGDNVSKNPVVFDRIISEGHLAANHTMFHSKGFKTTVSDYVSEVEKCSTLINGNKLFRPPYGQLKRAQYRTLIDKGFSIVFWDVISYDYETISPEKCAQNVLSHSREGSIVLFHDNIKAEQNLRYALPIFLKHFSERGFTFSTLKAYC